MISIEHFKEPTRELIVKFAQHEATLFEAVWEDAEAAQGEPIDDAETQNMPHAIGSSESMGMYILSSILVPLMVGVATNLITPKVQAIFEKLKENTARKNNASNESSPLSDEKLKEIAQSMLQIYQKHNRT